MPSALRCTSDWYTQSYDQAAQLMARRELFDISKEPPAVLDRYGTHDFGRHCLLGRRLLEAGATFVKVSHSNYDTHHENFDFHIEQLGEFDRSFATLLDDLHQRGLLESTLVVVMSEFGRTPTINRNYGRDHWGTAWSVALAGCGIRGGVVVGGGHPHAAGRRSGPVAPVADRPRLARGDLRGAEVNSTVGEPAGSSRRDKPGGSPRSAHFSPSVPGPAGGFGIGFGGALRAARPSSTSLSSPSTAFSSMHAP